MFGPVLTGERLRLAPPTPEMLPDFIRWLADPEVTRYLGVTFPPTLASEQEWFERMSKSGDDIIWAILLGDAVIGVTGIHHINWRQRRAITGNLIGEKSEWNKGYGSEAVRLRTRYAFDELNLEKIQTAAFMENVGSRRVLEKAGYQQIGVARRHEWRHGKWHDMWLAELLREDWDTMRC